MFRTRQLYSDFIFILSDGRGSCLERDYGVDAMMIMMSARSYTLDKLSEVRHAKVTFGHSTDLRH